MESLRWASARVVVAAKRRCWCAPGGRRGWRHLRISARKKAVRAAGWPQGGDAAAAAAANGDGVGGGVREDGAELRKQAACPIYAMQRLYATRICR